MTVRPGTVLSRKKPTDFQIVWPVLLIFSFLFFLSSVGFAQVTSPSAPTGSQGNVDSWLAKAENALRKRNFVSAQAYLARAMTLSPEHTQLLDLKSRLDKEIVLAKDACMKLADFYRSAKNVPKAMEQYQQILAMDPNNPDAIKGMAELGQTIRQVEQFQKAGIVVDQSSGRSWDSDFYSVVSQMRRARDAFASGNLDTAKQLLDQILQREKGMGEATQLLTEVESAIRIRNLLSNYNNSASKGELRAAIESLDNLIRIQPDEAKLYLWRGRLALRLGNFNSARSDFFASVKRGIPFSDIRLHLAECAAGLEEYPQAYALGSVHPALSGAKDSGFLWQCHWKSYPFQFILLALSVISFIGACFMTFQQFDHLVGRRPLSLLMKTFRFLVFCHFQDPMADIERAQQLAKALRLPWFHFLYALICCRQGRFETAQESLQASMASPALAPRAYFLMGLIRRNLRQSLQEHDFEQMVSLTLREPPVPWMPKYLKQLETEVLESLGVNQPMVGEALPLAFEAAAEIGMIPPRTSD